MTDIFYHSILKREESIKIKDARDRPLVTLSE